MRFSLLVTGTDATDAALVAETIASFRRQSFEPWELLLALSDEVRSALTLMTRRVIVVDRRIHIASIDQRASYGSALDAAYGLCSGEFAGIVEAGDLLAPTALADIEQSIASAPDTDCWYTDEDSVDRFGTHSRAFYKPDWSPERLRSQPYIGGLFLARRRLIDGLLDLASFTELTSGAETYDLTLRTTEVARAVGHVPKVLLHRRQPDRDRPHADAPDADLPDADLPDADLPRADLPRADVPQTVAPLDGSSLDEAARLAVAAQIRRLSIAGDVVSDASTHTQRVRRTLLGEPLISIVIPTRGSRGHVWGTDRIFVTEAVRSVVERSSYQRFELIVVADSVTPAAVLEELTSIAGDRLQLVGYDKPFNFSEKINLGRAQANGELLLLLNDDIEVISPDFLRTMAALAQEPDVGAVGAKLLLGDGRLQHGGHVYCGEPYHILWGRWRDDPGPFEMLAVQRECIGMTAACLMTRPEVFDEVGGFPVDFPIDFNDVEFALKLHQHGYRSVWTPAAELYHFETQTREKVSKPDDVKRMYSRWSKELHHDPYFNPNLAPHRDDWVERTLR